jgi:hypothetical protein
MASILIPFPGTTTYSAFVAVALAGLYLLLCKRGAAWRVFIVAATCLCLAAVVRASDLLSRVRQAGASYIPFHISLSRASIYCALAAVALAGLYLLLRKRDVAWRVGVLVVTCLCLLTVVLGPHFLHRVRHSGTVQFVSLSRSIDGVSVHTAAPPVKAAAISTKPVETTRAVYGHSIVKGGIHSLGELLDVIATDPLAAKHYKGFDVAKAHFIRLDHNIVAYVSYRVDGGGIYWTKEPKLIMAGEEVITDGTNYIRVRCGNEISYAQQAPVELDEPTDTETIVEYVPPPAPTPPEYAENFPPSYVAQNGSPPETPPPPTPGTVYTPPPMFFPPPIVPPTPPHNIDEFGKHGAFYALVASVVLLLLVERFRH